MERNKYFILHANCIPTKGAVRSLISDLQRFKYHYIPNDLFDLLELTKTKTLDEIYQSFSPENKEILDEYFDFLMQNNLGFIDEERDLFPDLNLEWEAPSTITNSILDIDEAYLSKIDYKNIFLNLSSLNCYCVQIRNFGDIGINQLQSLLDYTLNTRIKELRLVLKFSIETKDFIANTVIPNNKRITQIIFFNYSEDYAEYVSGVQIIYLKMAELTEMDCGQICSSSFTINIPHHTESLAFNTCLNRKVSIDSKGYIKNCPSQISNFGHVDSVDLKEVVKNNYFQSIWKIKKDDIKICKDCEHRHICTDCRVFIQDKNDKFSKPSKCSYDPYTATWN